MEPEGDAESRVLRRRPESAVPAAHLGDPHQSDRVATVCAATVCAAIACAAVAHASAIAVCGAAAHDVSVAPAAFHQELRM